MSNTVSTQNISTSAAHRLIAAAETRAAEIGVPSVIAICDTAGVLKAYTRMDGAPLMCVQVAQDKAYTAAGFGMPSHEWHDFIKDDAPLAAGAPAPVNLAFSSGPHRYIGAHVGRLQARVALDEILRRIPDFAIPDGYTPLYGNSSVARNMDELKLVFTPGIPEGDGA